MNRLKQTLIALTIAISFLTFTNCKHLTDTQAQTANAPIDKAAMDELPLATAYKPTPEFKDYWYAGEAELSSYKLEQARYGEIHDGTAVLVFVTEDFLSKEQVKADYYNKANTSVLKLNATKKFNTGVYPYSIMQSTFYPVSNDQHAIKVSCSVQEWCGHVYSQLNNREKFEIKSHSYFESEGDQELTLEKSILENELWTQLRIDPQSLPVGELSIMPALELIRLKHLPLKSYKANAKLTDGIYSISYPELGRSLSISFNSEFPYEISGWEDTYRDGYGTNAKTLTTRATKMKTIKSPYWSKNSNADEELRETLQLN